ncbi:hypothetical protein ABW19_dt0206447 [Dactylella cylindrospora]|nr:hypothetical protein ABW19_dt0206447 [Dactylella cylindrospora]
MSKSGDLLDFAKDVRRMSADNIQPPDTAPASKIQSQDVKASGSEQRSDASAPRKPTSPSSRDQSSMTGLDKVKDEAKKVFGE